jgi:hypothetical protein
MRHNLISAVSALALLLQGSVSFARTQTDHERVEVAFVLDTTGSMADLIDGAKRKIWSIASTIADSNPDADIAMALVAYRDRGDAYVVKTAALSEDIQGLYGKLIKLEAGGGDDTPESVNEALDKTIRNLQWSKGDNVKRIVFLVGDAPPHMDYAQERQYPEILKEARVLGIVVNAVQAGDMVETTGVWKEIAQFGRGRYIAIPQSGGEITITVTPYDDDILHLQGMLDETILPYGSRESQAEVTAKISERNEASDAAKIDNSKFYSKRKATKEIVTGGGDLIDDIRNKRVDLEKVADDELPEAVAQQPKAQRQAWLEEKTATRIALEAKIEALITKRDAFVVEEQKKTETASTLDSFDKAVEDTLKAQLN